MLLLRFLSLPVTCSAHTPCVPWWAIPGWAPVFPGAIFWGFFRRVQVTHDTRSTISPLRYLEAGCPSFPTSFIQSPWKRPRSPHLSTETQVHTLQKMAQNGSSASLGLNSGHRLLYYNCSPATRARAGSWIEDAARRTKHIPASLSPSIP